MSDHGFGSNIDEDAPALGGGVVDPIKSKRVTIVLEDNENIPPTGQFIGVNGRSYMLRSGEPASVPVEVIDVLNNAVQAVPDRDPVSQQVIGYRSRLRFPYRVVNPAG